MSERDPLLEHECWVFTRYLVGREPTEYVLSKYLDAHRVAPAYATRDTFHRRLLRVARAGPTFARLADAYARIFARHGVLRKKLILLLAVLETSPPFCHELEQREDVGAVAALAAAGVRVVGALATFLVAALVIGPVHVLSPSRRSGR